MRVVLQHGAVVRTSTKETISIRTSSRFPMMGKARGSSSGGRGARFAPLVLPKNPHRAPLPGTARDFCFRRTFSTRPRDVRTAGPPLERRRDPLVPVEEAGSCSSGAEGALVRAAVLRVDVPNPKPPRGPRSIARLGRALNPRFGMDLVHEFGARQHSAVQRSPVLRRSGRAYAPAPPEDGEAARSSTSAPWWRTRSGHQPPLVEEQPVSETRTLGILRVDYPATPVPGDVVDARSYNGDSYGVRFRLVPGLTFHAAQGGVLGWRVGDEVRVDVGDRGWIVEEPLVHENNALPRDQAASKNRTVHTLLAAHPALIAAADRNFCENFGVSSSNKLFLAQSLRPAAAELFACAFEESCGAGRGVASGPESCWGVGADHGGGPGVVRFYQHLTDVLFSHPRFAFDRNRALKAICLRMIKQMSENAR